MSVDSRLAQVVISLADSCHEHANNITASGIVPAINFPKYKSDDDDSAPYFPLLGFEKYDRNPVLGPNAANEWESAYVYNPAAIVIEETVLLFHRAQVENKTSSIGLAWSWNGHDFDRFKQPILTPTEPYEIPGGCEDPRVVLVNGTLYLTYTAFNGVTARLCMATSIDLINWTKHGLILPDVEDVEYLSQHPMTPYKPRKGWSKSGAVLDEPISGKYHMHYGEGFLYTATSTDLLHWEHDTTPFAQKLNVWEQGLLESGPPPVKTRDGKWIQIYNGVATGLGGYTAGRYSVGQMLIDPVKWPKGPPVASVEIPVLQPETEKEKNGQVNNVVFAEGLVQLKGKWFLYYGMADQYIGVATTPVQP